MFLTTVSYPIQGTPYYDEVAPRLVKVHDWAHSTDRELKISGRHSRGFYRFADQLLKSEVALQKLGNSTEDSAAVVTLRSQIEAARLGLLEAYGEVEA